MLVRGLLLLLLFFFLARAVWRLLQGVARGAAGDEPARPASRGVKMAQCPVCGTYIVPGKSISGTRAGRPVYYCSEQCRNAA